VVEIAPKEEGIQREHKKKNADLHLSEKKQNQQGEKGGGGKEKKNM